MSTLHTNIRIDLVRAYAYNDCIIGRLFLKDVYICDTLEPPYLEKYGCIPEGDYPVIIGKSLKFGMLLPKIEFVPARYNVEFHPGNYPHETKGCILPGFFDSSSGTNKVLNSKVALKILMNNLSMYDFIELSIYDEFKATCSAQ